MNDRIGGYVPFSHVDRESRLKARGIRIHRRSAPSQQPRTSWAGGHLTEPKEQKTQQSPGFGRSNFRQPLHSWKYRHASVGMISVSANPQSGQVRVDTRMGGGCSVIGSTPITPRGLISSRNQHPRSADKGKLLRANAPVTSRGRRGQSSPTYTSTEYRTCPCVREHNRLALHKRDIRVRLSARLDGSWDHGVYVAKRPMLKRPARSVARREVGFGYLLDLGAPGVLETGKPFANSVGAARPNDAVA